MVRSGKPWRMLHEKYGKWNTVFKRFRRWSVLGIFQDFQQNIIGLKKENNSNDEFSSAIIDSTTIKCHSCALGYKKGTSDNEKIGKSVGGKTSKLSVVVSDEKTVLKAELLSGNKHDSNSAFTLLKDLKNKQDAPFYIYFKYNKKLS